MSKQKVHEPVEAIHDQSPHVPGGLRAEPGPAPARAAGYAAARYGFELTHPTSRAIRAASAQYLQARLGNTATQSLIRGLRTEVSGAGPETTVVSLEKQANRMASSALTARSPGGIELASHPARSSAVAKDGIGIQALPADTRTALEESFGADFGEVRVDTGGAASELAQQLGARAFTAGSLIGFAPAMFSPKSEDGSRLLAHEMAHVLQQRALGRPLLQLDRDSPAASGTATKVPPATLPTPLYSTPADLASYSVPDVMDLEIDVAPPRLAGVGGAPRREDKPERIIFHSPVGPSTKLLFWAVPASLVTEIGSGVGQTSEGTIEIVGRFGEHVVTSTYTKLAVGAGSTSVLDTPAGVVLIDAGVHQIAGNADVAIAQATLQRLRQIVGTRPITEVLITHAHYDHTALLELIARNLDVRSLRINALQEMQPGFRTIERAMAAGREAYRQQVASETRSALEAQRQTWEATQPLEPDPGVRQANWEHYVNDTIAARLAQVSPIRVELLIPVEGSLHVVSTPIDRPGIPPGTEMDVSRPTTTGYQEPGRVALTDPNYARRLDEARRGVKPGSELDRYSTSYVIDLPGNSRLLVLPDLRAADFERVRSNFEAELRRLGSPSKFQIWDISHHMQSGWTTSEMRASQLLNVTRFLYRYSNVPAKGGGVGSEAVVVSVRGDPTNPSAENFVDPANVWLLRSLGLEVYLATSGHDIELLEVTTAAGRQISGIAAQPYEAGRPSDPLVRRARAAIDQLGRETAAKQQQLRTAADGPISDQLKLEIAGNQGKLTAIDRALLDYIDGVHRDIGRSPRSARPAVAPAQGAPEPAPAEAQALSDQLKGFDRPVVGETPHFTDVALVVLRREAAARLTPEGRQILEARDRINRLGAELATSEKPHVVQAELVTELLGMQTMLQQQMETATGPNRTLFEDELARVKAQADALTKAPPGTARLERGPAGELVETRVVAVRRLGVAPPETSAARAVRAGLEVGGQVMGGVMVYQTIRGAQQLQERFSRGEATRLEFAAGMTKSALGVTIGVRMVAAVPVSAGEFVLLSVLDVIETAGRDYDTDEQRNIAIAYSIIRNGVNLALMLVGQGLMESGNPVGMIAGTLLMFVADPLLDALGVYDFLQRALEFAPYEVTGANQKLRDLMAEYRVIVGSLELVEREDPQLSAIGATDPEAVRSSARAAINEHRIEAYSKEQELLGAFQEGYDRARTSYAGLSELDAMRREFLVLHHQVSPHDEELEAFRAQYYPWAQADQPSPIKSTRALAAETFQQIEQTLSLDKLSRKEIADLEQWKELADVLIELSAELYSKQPKEIDWHEASELERKADTMVRNARYRLNPAVESFRTVPLLSPGTEARAAYEEQLAAYVSWFQGLRVQLIEAARGNETGWLRVSEGDPTEAPDVGTSADATMALAEHGLSVYQSLIKQQPSLPATLSVELIYKSSAAASDAYRYHVAENEDYARGLQKMEAAERAVVDLASEAQRVVLKTPKASTDRLQKLLDGVQATIDDRRVVHGYLFLGESAVVAANIRAREVVRVAALLGERSETKPLSAEEMAAVESGDLGRAGRSLSTITNRLRQIPGLGIDGTDVLGIFVVVGDDIGPDRQVVTAEQNVLVGDLGKPALEVMTLAGDRKEITVLPINQTAVNIFGGPHSWHVYRDQMRPAAISNLKP